MTYQLGLLSDIALVKREGMFWTLDLWAKDLQAQVRSIRALTLFSPVLEQPPRGWELLPVPNSVTVVDVSSDSATIARNLSGVDVVQVPGNFSWRRSRRARSFMRLAHRQGKPVMLGISSDRATTLLVNARGQNFFRRARARMDCLSVKMSQKYLAHRCDGTFVVGEGLRRLVEPYSDNVFVGTASWIQASDLRPTAAARRDPSIVRLCAAARFEPMKGIGQALDAMASLTAGADAARVTLTIAGQGPEESVLRARSAALGLEDSVTFAGTFAYPRRFFEFLESKDIVVLTNLNDEQPRLIFDAISQGCLIVCPDSLPYRALGIPDRLLYRRGDAVDLAAAIGRAVAAIEDLELRRALSSIARAATIETMHERRREWVQSTLLGAHAREVLRTGG